MKNALLLSALLLTSAAQAAPDWPPLLNHTLKDIDGTMQSLTPSSRWPIVHSCRKASIGLSPAARRAGKKPKITPIAAEKKKDSRLMPGSNR